METSNTIVCPNCGAASTNLDNCEYCGSILVKIASVFQAEGKDATEELKKLGIGKSVYVNPDIISAIEQGVIQCQKYNTEIESALDFYSSCVDCMYLVFQPNSAPILKLNFNMKIIAQHHYFYKFERSEIYRLFNFSQIGQSMIGSIQMDNDAKTTAQFISYIVSKVIYTEESTLQVFTFVTINGVKYLIASDRQKRTLEMELKHNYNTYLIELKSSVENTYSNSQRYLMRLKHTDKILYNIYEELLNTRVWEFEKKQELQRRFHDRYKKITTKNYFMTTWKWRTEFEKVIHRKLGIRYWIDENATIENIKKIEQKFSGQDEPEAVCQDFDNNNTVDEPIKQDQKINNNSKTTDTSEVNLQDIAKQFIETLNKEIQAKTKMNITLNHWIILILVLVIIILIL